MGLAVAVTAFLVAFLVLTGMFAFGLAIGARVGRTRTAFGPEPTSAKAWAYAGAGCWTLAALLTLSAVAGAG